MSAGAAGGAVVRCGHLRKLKTMKKKYFVLRGDTPECSARLEYYESEKKFTSGALPRRALPLRSCFNITRRLDLRQKHVIALFTKEEQFCVVAESETELQAWLAALLQLHRADDTSDHLQHPIQHVWQVNVQKKGLGASKNIQGLYNLCLTDKTLTLVKIKSHNNVISDLGIPERVEYSLKNIRRCGDSECFFYMEVGRQTVTGAGELWMLSDDSNIAQSMHSTIYHAMRNCAKETENERDHIILPGKGSLDSSNPLPARRQTYSDGRGRAGLLNDKALCVGACMAQCVCPSATYSIEDSAAAIVPLVPFSSAAVLDPSNNSLTNDKPEVPRLIKHHRTVSLPTGCALFQEPLKISHGRTRSAPLTGEEVDKVMMEKAVMHSSCKTVNGTDVFPTKKNQWARRASTGARLSKLSPAHTKNAASLRSRCDSMPARATSCDVARLMDSNEVLDSSRDEPDADWLRTPRIPEEPDCDDRADNYMCMSVHTPPAPRLREFQLESVPALISDEGLRPARAYSVGSAPPRPGGGAGGGPAGGGGAGPGGGHAAGAAPGARAPHRTRAYSAGARRPTPHLMELDFTPPGKQSLSRSPAASVSFPTRPDVDEYVDMSPRSTTLEPKRAPDGYVEMTYGRPRPSTSLTEHPINEINSLYMKMNAKTESENNLFTRMKSKTDSDDNIYTRINSKNNSDDSLYKQIKSTTLVDREERGRKDSDEYYGRVKPPSSLATERSARGAELTPHGSQTIFPFSPEDEVQPPAPPAPAPAPAPAPSFLDVHPLSTVSELSEDTCGIRQSESYCDSDISSSPASYVRLKPHASLAIDVPQRGETNVTATVVVARDNPRLPAPPLNYAALDLEPRRVTAPNAPTNYTQIDFVRSDKLHADVN